MLVPKTVDLMGLAAASERPELASRIIPRIGLGFRDVKTVPSKAWVSDAGSERCRNRVVNSDASRIV
jgi:hypothetical protein